MAKAKATDPVTTTPAAAEVSRGSYNIVDPDYPNLIIVGLDEPVTPETEHLHDDAGSRTSAARATPERIANYRAHGVRTPVKVEIVGGKRYIVDGRGRVIGARAAKLAQLRDGDTQTIRVPFMVEKGTAEDLFGLSRLLNVHDIDDTLTNAKNAQRMLNMHSSVEKVALAFQVTAQTIRNWTSMLSVDKEVVQAVRDGELTPTAAMALAGLAPEEQKEVAKELADEAKESGKKVTVAAAKAKAAAKAGKEPAANTPKLRLEKIEKLMWQFSGLPKSERTKETMAEYLDKICRATTGHTIAKLEEMGD